MKILTKRGLNDYYDYICGTEGIDSRVVYDRRDPCILNKSTYEGDYVNPWLRALFGHDIMKNHVRRLSYMFDDHKKFVHVVYCSVPGKKWPKREKRLSGNIFLMCLEVGFVQWYFEIERWIDEDGKLQVDRKLIDKKRVQKDHKVSSSVVAIIPCSRTYSGEIRFERDESYDAHTILEFTNPIMKDTWIPGFIDARDMYDAIYEWCAAQNDHEFVDTRTNDEHIESNGFDRKTSFRNIK